MGDERRPLPMGKATTPQEAVGKRRSGVRSQGQGDKEG